MRNKPRLPKEMKRRVRELRQDATDAERLLWARLRDRRFMHAKFRRQHPVQGYVLDFYCDEAKLGIELDGNMHRETGQAQYDQERTTILAEQLGIKVLRFWNSEVLKQTEGMLQTLANTLANRLSIDNSHPSQFGRRAGDEGQKE